MASESSFWQYLRKKLKGKGDFQRHEDISAIGVPDVSYGWNGADGWIELKYYSKWKKQDFNHISAWTREQRLWLRKRWSRGSKHCFLFVKIDKYYLLFSGNTLFQDGVEKVIQDLAEEDLLNFADMWWHNSVDISQLERHLTA